MNLVEQWNPEFGAKCSACCRDIGKAERYWRIVRELDGPDREGRDLCDPCKASGAHLPKPQLQPA